MCYYLKLILQVLPTKPFNPGIVLFPDLDELKIKKFLKLK